MDMRSKYRGVRWYPATKQWRARIYEGSKEVHLGYFDDEEEAAGAYDKAAKSIHGDKAKLNFS